MVKNILFYTIKTILTSLSLTSSLLVTPAYSILPRLTIGILFKWKSRICRQDRRAFVTSPVYVKAYSIFFIIPRRFFSDYKKRI